MLDLNLQIASSLTQYLSVFVAYCISTILAGIFTAWVALKMGDDTPAQEGFLSLNPLIHIDFMGTLFLLMFGIGWGRFIPINPFNMGQRHRVLKGFIAYMASPFAYFTLALLCNIGVMSLSSYIFNETMAKQGHVSSYLYAFLIILDFGRALNILLFVITLLINIFGLGFMFYIERKPEYVQYASIIMIIVPIAIFWATRNFLPALSFALVHKISLFLENLLHLFY